MVSSHHFLFSYLVHGRMPRHHEDYFYWLRLMWCTVRLGWIDGVAGSLLIILGKGDGGAPN